MNGSSVYVAGQFNSPLIGFGSVNVFSNNQSGFFDIVVAKLNDVGTTTPVFSWAQQAGGTGHDYATGLAVRGSLLHVVGSATIPARFGTQTLSGSAATATAYLATLSDNVTTATNSPALLAGLGLYPNPAHHRVTLQLPVGTQAAATATLLDGTGRKVRTAFVVPGATGALEFSLTGLAAGLYYVQLQLGDQRAARALMVE
ncbi:T9SS type A sorting domain-containing protein [Hymenobacter cellulosilyticus]|uniref:T9SS type A sorting domain-containing protein n=1 Tax=Hymenobacter cellulosilyticus TaxID=2932248 RepID=A0A8T9Q196_9BACT|nr:T9SS type A sorting domain-containing protein [Hymenobacter cellulosilyticus]UOQ71244.1 T9SS type A sorting domain-containing protein [Hymenobacter cellulosilyticus]